MSANDGGSHQMDVGTCLSIARVEYGEEESWATATKVVLM